MEHEPMPFKHGEVCEHETLKRKCDVCHLQWENALNAASITALEEAVRVLAIAADTPMAWKLRDCPECQKIRDDIANNPIAAEAVRKASNGI